MFYKKNEEEDYDEVVEELTYRKKKSLLHRSMVRAQSADADLN